MPDEQIEYEAVTARAAQGEAAPTATALRSDFPVLSAAVKRDGYRVSKTSDGKWTAWIERGTEMREVG